MHARFSAAPELFPFLTEDPLLKHSARTAYYDMSMHQLQMSSKSSSISHISFSDTDQVIVGAQNGNIDILSLSAAPDYSSASTFEFPIVYTICGHHTSHIYDTQVIDNTLYSASADQQICLTDLTKMSLRYNIGVGSVPKSVHTMPTSPTVIATGTRGGWISLYDTRRGKKPVLVITNAHIMSPGGKVSPASIPRSETGRTTPKRALSAGVTVAKFHPRRPHLLASGGAKDGLVKIWDLRAPTWGGNPSSPPKRDTSSNSRLMGKASLISRYGQCAANIRSARGSRSLHMLWLPGIGRARYGVIWIDWAQDGRLAAITHADSLHIFEPRQYQLSATVAVCNRNFTARLAWAESQEHLLLGTFAPPEPTDPPGPVMVHSPRSLAPPSPPLTPLDHAKRLGMEPKWMGGGFEVAGHQVPFVACHPNASLMAAAAPSGHMAFYRMLPGRSQPEPGWIRIGDPGRRLRSMVDPAPFYLTKHPPHQTTAQSNNTGVDLATCFQTPVVHSFNFGASQLVQSDPILLCTPLDAAGEDPFRSPMDLTQMLGDSTQGTQVFAPTPTLPRRVFTNPRHAVTVIPGSIGSLTQSTQGTQSTATGHSQGTAAAGAAAGRVGSSQGGAVRRSSGRRMRIAGFGDPGDC
eukprot:gnl/Dysnectes_brevis/2031_a2343_789.p1 GENE.gnl/Dysnectes_brevis/2031_a2343_789~~gnl/Dysnectes_brevis/2031_a2343_789.p1  ORF type:complete len:635 (-),score=137.04 gnl/Dysnectes_brevis/2031_a2343_789:238-2142(-)